MAEENEPETETEETETEETETEETSGPDNWQKMEALVDKVIGKRLESWQPVGNNSSGKSKTENNPAPRKKDRKKGFLSDWFEGL